MKKTPLIDVNVVRTLDDVVSDSIDFFKANFKQLFKCYYTICGIFILVSLSVGVVNFFQTRVNLEEGNSIFSATYFIALFLNLLSTTATIITTLAYIAVYRDKGQQTPEVEEVWSYFKHYFFRGFITLIAIAIVSAIGFLFCFLPGIYLFTVLSLMLPIITMENSTMGYASDRCFKIIKGNFWTVFGSMFVMTIIVYAIFFASLIPVMLIAQIYAMVGGTSLTTFYTLPLTVWAELLKFLMLLPVIGIAINYFSLTEKKDGVSLLERIEAFGTNEVNGDQQLSEEY